MPLCRHEAVDITSTRTPTDSCCASSIALQREVAVGGKGAEWNEERAGDGKHITGAGADRYATGVVNGKAGDGART